MNNSASQKRSRRQPRRKAALPLRPLALRSAPYNRRALAWSADAELAVAADDSVYVFVPQWGPAVGDTGRRGRRDDDGDYEGEDEDEAATNVVDGDDGDPAAEETESRSQFAAGGLHIPACFPPLDARLNRRLFAAAAGLPTTTAGVGGGGGQGEPARSDGKGADTEEYRWTRSERNSEEANEHRRPSGAGVSGVLTPAAGTMNSVVAVAWSPAGVGHGGRPVLGVLTAAGVLAVYGEALPPAPGAGAAASGASSEASSSRSGRGRRGYDASRWAVLWAVGERFTVPGEGTSAEESPECVVSFAWSGGLPGGEGGRGSAGAAGDERVRALLMYATDAGAIVVLSVGKTSVPLPPKGRGGPSAAISAWHVYEVARFAAPGPHPGPEPPAARTAAADPHFVPSGTAFGMQCSSWLVEVGEEEDAPHGGGTAATVHTCLVAYLARNYIGFRRVTVRTTTTSVAGGSQEGTSSVGKSEITTTVAVDPEDVDGLCLFLGADAFLEWEDGIWTVEGEDALDDGSRRYRQKKVCRGVVATPMVAKAFEVEIASAASRPTARGTPVPPHDLAVCDTTYPPPGLIIHPPHPAHHRGAQPLYTLVRQSATATNHDWYECNGTVAATATTATASPDQRGTASWPQWADEVANKVQAHVPANLAQLGRDDEEDATDVQSLAVGSNDGSGSGGRLQLAASSAAAPDVYLHRVRLWGLALAPGGAGGGRSSNQSGPQSRIVTAVLATEHAAQHADRGGWYRDRSRVLFAWGPAPQQASAAAAGTASPSTVVVYTSPQPSTEARMWAWLYGGGPPVVAAGHYNASAMPPSVRAVFRRLAARQVCSICGTPIQGGSEEEQDAEETQGTDDNGGGGGATTSASPATLTLACARGHVFDRCGATGLAIQRPGASRACGVCGSRTLRAGALAALLEGLEDENTEADRAALRLAVAGDACGRCGGKFHD